MTALLIKNFPPELHQKLKERASKNRRSMTNEALVLLESILLDESETKAVLPKPFRGAFVLTDEWIDAAKREGRE